MSHCPDRMPGAHDTILRFVAAERLLHWAIAVPFLGCFASAVVLVVVYNLDPTRPYRTIFAWMHRGCGAGLIVCPSLVLLASVRHWRIHLYNVRQAWVWTFDDIKWLALMGLAALSSRITLPDQGKFNAAEKLNFMMVMVCPPLFIVTGLLIWFPESTNLGAFAPWLVHFGLATMAVPLMLGHMIMATLNPSTRVGLRGMITGFVSRDWAAHHYARWFREQFPDLVREGIADDAIDDGLDDEEAVAVAASAGIALRPQSSEDVPVTVLPPRSEVIGVAQYEFDRFSPTAVLAGAVADAPFGGPEADFVVDEPDEMILPAGYDRVATVSQASRRSPNAVATDR